MSKAPLTPTVVSEWDVVRRTAEFFDGVLGNLRTFGLTASVTLIGVAFEFNVSALLIAAGFLNVGLFFVDRRYQAYLEVTAQYAMAIEDKYNFNSSGLTHKITDERNKHRYYRPETIFLALYFVLALVSFSIGIIFLGLSLRPDPAS